MILNKGFYIVEIDNDNLRGEDSWYEKPIIFSDSESEIINECEKLNAKLPSNYIIDEIMRYLYKYNVAMYNNQSFLDWIKENPFSENIEKYMIVLQNKIDKNFRWITYEIRKLESSM